MNLFWTLVKNDLGFARMKRKYQTWRHIYLIIALICGWVIYTVLLFNKTITPDFIVIIPAYLIFYSFFASIRTVKMEWNSQTVGWWLQLPYSRNLLLGAKLTSGFIRYVRVMLLLFMISLLLWSEGMLILPGLWKEENLLNVLLNLGRIYLQFMTFSPVMIVFGILIVVLSHSSLNYLSPLIQVAFGALASLGYSNFFQSSEKLNSLHWVFTISGMSGGVSYLIYLAADLLITAIGFISAVIILKSKVDL